MNLRFAILILVSMSKERHKEHRNATNAGFAAFLNKSIFVGFFSAAGLIKSFSSILTASPFKPPRNLRTSDSTMSSFRVTWEPAPGRVKGYKVTFHPTEDDRNLGELIVGPYDSTVVLEELRYG